MPEEGRLHILVVQADPLVYPAELFPTEQADAEAIEGLKGEYVLRRTLPLDLHSGWEMIERGIITEDQPMRLVRLYPPTADRLEEYVIRSNNNGMPIDVLHFSCHGDLFKYGRFWAKPGESDGEKSGRQGEDRGPDEVKLLLEDQDGIASPYTAENLAELIMLGGEYRPQFVILDACYSAYAAKPEPEPIFVKGLKKALAEANAPIPTVIGMTKEVDVGFAASYAAQLYRLTSLKMGFKEAHKEALDRAKEDYRKKTGVTYRGGKPEIVLEGTVRRDLHAGEPEVVDQKRPPGYPTGGDPPLTFTGREKELVEIARLLDPAEGFKSACIWGPGGTGKTALAQAALSRNAWRYAGENQRIAWISLDLEGVSTEEGLIDSLGKHLSCVFTPPDANIVKKRHQVLNFFESGYHLIILDNLESILDDETGGAMPLVKELENNPRVFVVMTSREIAAAARRIEIRGLGGRGIYLFSNVVKQLRGEQTKAYQETSDSFNWIDSSVNKKAPATEICKTLENDPLMIEQVASNLVVDYEPFKEALKKIKEGVKKYRKFAASGVKERHATQAACFKYSYDRLPEGSVREVLTVVACLSAGVTLATLEDIVSEPKELEEDLTTLLVRSLIRREETSGDVAVYGMHRVRADLALEFEEEKRRKEIIDKVASKILDHTSFVVSLFNAGHYDYALILWEAIVFTNASQLLSEPIAGFLDISNVAKLKYNLGVILTNTFRFDDAEKYFIESLDISREREDGVGVGINLVELGSLYTNTGRFGDAEECYEESLRIWKDSGYPEAVAANLLDLGILYHRTDRYDKAEKLYKESLQIWKKHNNQKRIASILYQLGMLYQDKQRYDEAENRYKESLKIAKDGDDAACAAMTQRQLGKLYQDTKRPSKAKDCYNESLKMFRDLENQAAEAKTLHWLGTLYHEIGSDKEADGCYKKALSFYEKLNDADGVSRLCIAYGRLRWELEDADGAISLLTLSVALAGSANDMGLLGAGVSGLLELKEKVPPEEMKTKIREALAEHTDDEETLEGFYEEITKLLELE